MSEQKDISYIPYAETGYFKKIVTDYVSGAEDLRSFYREKPTLENIPKGIVERSQFDAAKRATLVEVLKEQYKGLQMTAGVESNLKKLAERNCFTITTGHQLNLFTGPLYFVYKILHAIKLAEACSKKYSDHQFVPVYWMHTEDHDVEEIAQFNLFGKKIEWASAGQGAAGDLKTESLMTILFEVKNILGDKDQDKEIIRMLEESYLGNPDLASATRHFVHGIFGKLGVLILDPRDKRLKAQAKNLFKNDLSQHHLYDKVKESSDSLGKRGYKVQALPRAINLFHLKDSQRQKILYLDQVKKYQFEKSGEIMEEKELLKICEDHPEQFSPNVMLRPLYQESILPNLAYIGGGGELAYWLQLKAGFEHFNVPFPLLVLRQSILWIDNQQKERMTKFNLDPKDLFGDTDALISNFAKKEGGDDALLDSEKKELEAVYMRILNKAKAVSPNLEKSVLGDYQKQVKALQNIEGKILREVKRKNETAFNRIRKIKEKLFPSNSLQERKDNLVEFWAKEGSGFIDALLEVDYLKGEMGVMN